MNNSKLKYWPILFLMILIEGFVTLIWLALIPSDANGSIFLGFSYKRLMMMAFIIILIGIAAYLGFHSWRQKDWCRKWLNPMNKPGLYRWMTIFLLVIAVLIECLLFYLRNYNPDVLSPLYIRSKPLLGFVFLICTQLVLWLQILKLNHNLKLFFTKSIFWLFVWICISILISMISTAEGRGEIHTWWYILTFDQARYELHGSDYCSEDYLGDIDSQYQRANDIKSELADIDRSKALRGIFNKITRGAKTNTEKHLLLLAFIQKTSHHTRDLPSFSPGDLVIDPLVLLELGNMWCSQGAYLAIDLFGAAGYPGRMVQLAHHQIAEIYYDGGWHYFDTDLFGNGESVLYSNEMIPSVAEMSRGDYQQIDALNAYQEKGVRDCTHSENGKYYYPSYFYFSSQAYLTDVPQGYYIGSGEPYEFEQGYIPLENITPEDIIVETNDGPQRTPSKPKFTSVHLDDGVSAVTISFYSTDPDNDLQGYQVFISDHSRGWDYNEFYGDHSTAAYWANPNGWKPEMYDLLFKLPPSNLGLKNLDADKNQVTIQIKRGQVHFISVMPYDAYGLSIGRKVFPVSNELSFEIP